MKHTGFGSENTDIAIIGMGCIFPKSRCLKEYWNLIFNGVDAIDDIPEETHWKLKDYFDADPATPDHTYCKRGGFLPQLTFDPLDYGIPPNNLEATDTSQLLALEVAKNALVDAGYPIDHPFLKEHKVNVVLGVTGTQELVIPLGARLGHPIWKKALKDSGIPKEKREEILERIQGDYVQWQENSFPGLLGNVIAGRVANRFDLSGTNTASDAACASSLSALHTAVMELATGRCDMSITGGADTLNDIFMHMCFSKTGVLSHTSDAKPFSKDADGTVLGEGVGLLVLKRLEDAQKDNDRIYAVIKSVGTSSDGKTSAIYAPDAAGQLKALNDAYQKAGIDPATVRLIEAHGTGTRVGDKVEFDALKNCFNQCTPKNSTAIGSVKSMIGHTKAAAGAAGLIKAALALHHKVLPPTLKAANPDPELNINESSFYLNDQSKPWVSLDGSHPRRSGVSAFGFGGSNFHVVLEEYTASKSHISWDGSVQIFPFSADTREQLSDKIQAVLSYVRENEKKDTLDKAIAWQASELRNSFDSQNSLRLVFVHNTDQDILVQLEEALACIQTGQSDNSAMYYSAGKKKGRLGFLFPGQGSQYAGMGKDLVATFPEALNAVNTADSFFQTGERDRKSRLKQLHEYIFAPPAHIQAKKISEEQLRNTDIAQPAIGAISLGMIRILQRFGVQPDMTCGHSFGELSALCSAGWLDETDFLSLSTARGKYMAAAGSKDDAGSMLAVRAPLSDIQTLITEENLDLVLANKNSPMQGVLSGDTAEILRAKKICKSKKIRAVQLPVAAAFHSRLVKEAAKPFTRDVAEVAFTPTGIKVLSNTTGSDYGIDTEQIQSLLGNQLANPVQFVDNIECMVSQKVDTFIEVGPKAVLTGLVNAILPDKEIEAIALDGTVKKGSGIENLAHVLAQIAAKGFDIDLGQWEDPVEKPEKKRMAVVLTGANPKPKNRCQRPKSKPCVPEAAREPEPARAPLKKATSLKQRDTGMTTNRDSKPIRTESVSPEAMKMVQQGLEAMQQLQSQTARAHEKFLETQAQATRTLAGMLEQTRYMAGMPISYYPPATRDNTIDSTNAQQSRVVPQQQEVVVNDPVAAAPSTVEEPLSLSSTEDQISVKIDTKAAEPADSSIPSDEHTQTVLFDIVSQLTGFPVEMLETSMDIESDLGIDSIKKVEIVSELEKRMPSCEGLTPENIGSVRTLQDICQAITPADETVSGNLEISAEVKKEISDHDEIEKDDAGDISNVLLETISELTGFPVEMLEPTMSLESDLGIDSIKRVEILSRLEQQLAHIDSISPDDVGSLHTIGEIRDYLSSGNQTESKKKLPAQQDKKKTPVAPETVEKQLIRQVVALKEYPTNQIRFYNGAKIELSSSRKVYITRDDSGLGARFCDEFKKDGISAELIDIVGSPVPDLPDAAGIVLLPDAFGNPDMTASLRFLKSAFALVNQNAKYLMDAAADKGAFLSGISFLGGTFGFSDQSFASEPVLGGLPGFIKTAALEFKPVLCRALDMPDDLDKCCDNTEAAVALLMTHGTVEMGIDGESCYIPELEQKPVDGSMPVVKNNDVIIVTGGAKGVTAACAVELARTCSPVIALVGRSSDPFEEEAWSNGVDDPVQLKKAILSNAFPDLSAGVMPKPADVETVYQKIMSNRSITETIASIESLGTRVRYYSADITDKDRMEIIVQELREEFGKISGIIHGAGVLEDKLIIDKKPDQFERVLETKVLGLDAVLSATKEDRLSFLVLFSSVAARTGNLGQSDYALANEILNKTAKAYMHDHPDCKVVSINWGPWEGGMVDPSLKKQFEKRGIDLIPLHDGARQMISEISNPNPDGPEIVIGAHLTESKKKKSVKLAKAMSVTMGPRQMPVLSSHRIGGEHVVPFAMIMEYQSQAVVKNNPGLTLSGIDDMRLLKGIRLADDLTAEVKIGKCRPAANGFEAPAAIVSTNETGTEFIHSQGQMLLKEKRREPPVLSQAAFMSLTPYSRSIQTIYEDILFHGPDLQCIKAVNGCSQKGIEVVTELSPNPDQWIETPGFSRWILDPMMLDAAFQAAILWTYETRSQVCLPAYIANLRLYASFDTLKGQVRILFTVNEESKNKIKGYFTFLNENNTVVASITGFEAIVESSLKEKFENRPLFSRESILAFAEGNPSDAFGDKYQVFDEKRAIARLPRPPYFFMDRVIRADHPQWEMQPGGTIETEYDIPAEEWYFKANQTNGMPFCILLEIALQPCGWLAAYAGSALHSEERLHFRNLGGKATLYETVGQTSGTVTVKCRMTEVSKAGGMIIQDFEMAVYNRGRAVYEGKTNFGFFTGQALSNQVGIRNSRFSSYQLPEKLKESAGAYDLAVTAPLSPDDKSVDSNNGMPSKALLMVDSVEALSFEGGLYDKGYIKAIKTIDSKEWFFDAHFYQDPVCPGSLGVESFLQVIRFYMLQKFDIPAEKYEAGLMPGSSHEWIYRGQIIPKNKQVVVHVHIKDAKAGNQEFFCTADGALVVDGICIYEMNDFSFAFTKAGNRADTLQETKERSEEN